MAINKCRLPEKILAALAFSAATSVIRSRKVPLVMGMTPEQYFDSFVLGNLGDCQDNPASLRRAFNAAVSASHLADHYFNFNSRHHPDRIQDYRSLSSFIEHLCAETNGSFRDLRSISNAYKHLYIEGRSVVNSTVLSGGTLEAIEYKGDDTNIAEIYDEYEEGPAVTDFRSFVQFRRKDGTVAQFLPVLESFVAYWSMNFE